MALVAAGKADAVISLEPKNEWDVAAGALLVEAAGGVVTDLGGRPMQFNQRDTLIDGVIAAGPTTHAAIRELMTRRPATSTHLWTPGDLLRERPPTLTRPHKGRGELGTPARGVSRLGSSGSTGAVRRGPRDCRLHRPCRGIRKPRSELLLVTPNCEMTLWVSLEPQPGHSTSLGLCVDAADQFLKTTITCVAFVFKEGHCSSPPRLLLRRCSGTGRPGVRAGAWASRIGERCSAKHP